MHSSGFLPATYVGQHNAGPQNRTQGNPNLLEGDARNLEAAPGLGRDIAYTDSFTVWAKRGRACHRRNIANANRSSKTHDGFEGRA